MEILVKSRGHEQLLELLRGLGQGVEFAGVLPGGHQVVPGPLGGGGGEDGGGDLQKAVSGHSGAQGGHHLTPQDDIVLHLRVAQVQVAVLQPGGLVGLSGAGDGEGQLVVAAAAQHLNFGGDHLDVAGGQLGIFAVPFPDGPGDGDHRLLVQLLGGLDGLLGLQHHLGGAVEVPEDQEGQVLAHLTQILHPAGQGDRLAHLLHAQLAAGVGAVVGACLTHENQLLFVLLSLNITYFV